MLTSREYDKNLERFGFIDGVKAILLYSICILVLCLQGFAYTTNLSVNLLDSLQVWSSLFLLVIVILFIVFSNEKMDTVGLNRTKLLSSILLGLGLAIFMLLGMALYFVVTMDLKVGVNDLSIVAIIVFLIGVIEEEIFFRGYIETRLTGLIKNAPIVSCCTAVMFLLMHYPVRWVVCGFSLDVLSAFYVVSLLVLHFLCDFVYRKTNCLWGAIMLHFVYNIGQAMLIF